MKMLYNSILAYRFGSTAPKSQKQKNRCRWLRFGQPPILKSLGYRISTITLLPYWLQYQQIWSTFFWYVSDNLAWKTFWPFLIAKGARIVRHLKEIFRSSSNFRGTHYRRLNEALASFRTTHGDTEHNVVPQPHILHVLQAYQYLSHKILTSQRTYLCISRLGALLWLVLCAFSLGIQQKRLRLYSSRDQEATVQAVYEIDTRLSFIYLIWISPTWYNGLGSEHLAGVWLSL